MEFSIYKPVRGSTVAARFVPAQVAELADAVDSKSSGEILVGSIPTLGTNDSETGKDDVVRVLTRAPIVQTIGSMKLTFAGAVVLVVVMAGFAGCKPKEAKTGAVTLVPETERSRHFAAVNAQLELGGTLYGYADVDGDILKVAPYLRTLADTVAEQQPMVAPFLKQDFSQLLTELGLNDIRAVGLSSVPAAGGGFRNRVYLHTPEGRRGLLSGLGGAPAAFTHARLAPADADLYAETDFDAAALYAAVRALVVRVAGEPLAGVFEQQLQADKHDMGVTPLGLIQSLRGRATLVIRTDAERTLTLPGVQPVVLPAVQVLARIDGLAVTLGPVLEKLPDFTVTQLGAVKVYALKASTGIEGLQPVLAMEGEALYFATDEAFLRASLARTDGLDKDPAFVAALAELGDKGNGVTYVSPRLFDQMRRIKTLNPQIPAEALKGVEFILGALPAPTQPLVAVRINLPEGILYRARWHRSLKQDLAMVGVYNPATVGLMAAMAVPAFQKVRATSKEKAIMNNLRQFSEGADQYMLENGTTSATYAQIIGPDKYVHSLTPVNGEDYTRLVVRQRDVEVRVTTKDGKVVRLSR